MVKSRGRIFRVLSLSCASLPLCACFLAFYPESYGASGFEEFRYRVEFDPPCLERPLTPYSGACEATITREASGEYIVVLGVSADGQSDSPYLPPRVMTEAEVERMLALFGELDINRHPWPFCTIPVLGLNIDYSRAGAVYRWDDLELVADACDRARLDWRQAIAIGRFLDSLVD